VVLRSGAYVVHDDGHYREVTPLSGADGFRAALRIRGRVLSMPEPGLALLDFGRRDVSFDLGLPVPKSVTRVDGREEPLSGCLVTALADQHAFLSCPPESRLGVGEVVSCGISHPCTALDKWRLIPMVDRGRVVDVIRTFF
jgi:D-serine deaminase-like pyridoxal phosphate-dependent protein